MNLSNRLFSIFIITTLYLFFASPLLKLEAKDFDFDFSSNNRNWQGDFADYPVGEEVFFELGWGWTTLPVELFIDGKRLGKGMFLSGNNHSDDLFMFIKRRVNGLKPDTFYDLTFQVIIENNIPPGLFGVGGSPGESVFFKVGGSKVEPQKVNINGTYRMNIDVGIQSNSGKNAIVIGNLANPLVDPNNPQFEPKVLSNECNPLRVKTDDKGRLWLLVGTDSGFEAFTLYYIASISVTAKRACE